MAIHTGLEPVPSAWQAKNANPYNYGPLNSVFIIPIQRIPSMLIESPAIPVRAYHWLLPLGIEPSPRCTKTPVDTVRGLWTILLPSPNEYAPIHLGKLKKNLCEDSNLVSPWTGAFCPLNYSQSPYFSNPDRSKFLMSSLQTVLGVSLKQFRIELRWLGSTLAHKLSTLRVSSSELYGWLIPT